MKPKHGITGIDHPVFGVRDLDSARRAFHRLGFMIPPRGSHPQWGTGNWCIMFPDNYLELRGMIDPAGDGHGLKPFLKIREGLMGVALGTVGADVSHDSLAADGLNPNPVKSLTRDFELSEGTVPVSFRLCFLPEEMVPGLMSVVICQHLTPEILRQPEWFDHPNGARGVHSMTGIVRDPVGTAKALARHFDNVTSSEERTQILLPDSIILELISETAYSERYCNLSFSPPLTAPSLVSVSLKVDDLDRTEKVLRQRGVLYFRNESLVVAPEECCGAAIEFIESARK